MERSWTFDRLAVMMRRIDFLDPALAGQLDVRERGVRVEIKPAQTQARGLSTPLTSSCWTRRCAGVTSSSRDRARPTGCTGTPICLTVSQVTGRSRSVCQATHEAG